MARRVLCSMLLLSPAMLIDARGDLIVPVESAATTGTNFGNSGTNAGFTNQQLYPVAELIGLSPGDTITGMALRLDEGQTSAAPVTEQTISRFDVIIGAGSGSYDTTFATNFASTPTVARAGSIVLSPGFFPADNPGGAHSFSAIVPFDTPYVYTGGDLLIELRSIMSDENFVFDYWGSSQTTGLTMIGAGDNATTADLNFATANSVVQLQFTPVPEPSSVAFLTLGITGVALRRRRNRRTKTD